MLPCQFNFSVTNMLCQKLANVRQLLFSCSESSATSSGLLEPEPKYMCADVHVPTAGWKDANLRNFVTRKQQKSQIQIQSHYYFIPLVPYPYLKQESTGFLLPESMATCMRTPNQPNSAVRVCDSSTATQPQIE
jgi:hypothetical protein